MHEPRVDLFLALFHGGILLPKLRDPVGLDSQFHEGGISEDEHVAPCEVFAPLLHAEIPQPFVGQTPPIPLADGDLPQRLLDLNEASVATAAALSPKLRRATDAAGADDFEQREERIPVGASFRLSGERMESTPSALDRLIERNSNAKAPPQFAALAIEAQELFVEVVLGVEHEGLVGIRGKRNSRQELHLRPAGSKPAALVC